MTGWDPGRYRIDAVTYAPPATVIPAFAGVLAGRLGPGLTPGVLANHVAQSAFETGHWRSCHHWNFGNVKASASWSGLYTFFGCNERLQGRYQWFHPARIWAWPGHEAWVAKHPSSRESDWQTRWRAYETLGEGLAAQVSFLADRPGYAAAWAASLTGDPRQFAAALKRCRYYTAPESHYASVLSSVFSRYLPSCTKAVEALAEASARPPPLVVEPPPEISDDARRTQALEQRLARIRLEVDWEAQREARDRWIRGEEDL